MLQDQYNRCREPNGTSEQRATFIRVLKRIAESFIACLLEMQASKTGGGVGAGGGTGTASAFRFFFNPELPLEDQVCHLPISPYISPHLPTSPHISPCMTFADLPSSCRWRTRRGWRICK